MVTRPNIGGRSDLSHAAPIVKPDETFASRISLATCGKMLARRSPLRFDPNQPTGMFPSPFPDLIAVITDPLFYLLALPAIIALGLGKGGFAGVGMVSTPLLALSVPPLQAAAILLPILLCQDAISVFIYRRQWSAWNLKVLLPGAVFGVGAAWLFAAYVPNAYVEIAVGVTGICFALYNWFGKLPAQPRRPSVAVGMFWGSLAGFTSTIIQVGAPPYQVHILPQRLDKLTLIGTTIIFFALVNVMKLVPYFALGQFSPRTLATSVVLLPFALAANVLGLWLARRSPTELFYRITYLLMFLISLALIWQGGSTVHASI
jgi:uncharacterized protein